MKVNVKKLNGAVEPLDIGKILKWGNWACADSPNISFESILAATEASFYDGVATAEINLAICTQCEVMAMVEAQEESFELVEEYTHIARNLYIPTLLKKSNYFQSKYLSEDDILVGGQFKITENNIVPLPRYKLKSLVQLGVKLDTYDSAFLDGSISDELFEYADSLLDYSFMNNLKFGGMRQFEGKYLRRIDGNLLEDPLQLQLLVALAAVRADISHHPDCKTIEGQKEALENYYRLNRNVEQNLPTPFLLCFRTNSKTYDSCCLVNMGDSNPSIRSTQTVVGEATEAGAGLGINMGRIRSKGSKFKKMGKHQGLLGYLGLSSKNLKANNQECYSEDTEILTNRGYILFSRLTDEDMVAQVHDDLSIEYVRPTKRFSYFYEGKMVSLQESLYLDLLVTPNHMLTYKTSTNGMDISDNFTETSAEDYIPSDTDIFYLNDKEYILSNSVIKSEADYNGVVYCVEVPTHKLIVRRNGKSVVCGNSRGGSGTINMPVWTRDFYDLVMLKDVTGVEGENRYRHLDYCFSFSMYLVDKIRNNEKILLVSPHTLLPSGKTVYDAFFTNKPGGGYDDSEFQAYCEEMLKDPNLPYVNNENNGTGKPGAPVYTHALDLFLTLCRQMINTGRIYTFNATHVNNHGSFLSPVEMTNLCLAANTPILTREGYYHIQDLENKEVEVWNGKQWSKTTFIKTSENSKLYKIIFSDGSEITTTEYHKWYTQNTNYLRRHDKSELKRTIDLTVGDYIQKHSDNYICNSDRILDKAYTNGFYSGDGHFDSNKLKASAWIYTPKLEVLPYLECESIGVYSEKYKRTLVTFTGLEDKFFVPLGYNLKSKLEWFAGILDSDGTVSTINNQDQIQLCSINIEFLRDIRLMLSELGIVSKLTLIRDAHTKRFTPDQKEYECKTLYRLTISCFFVTKLLSLGLKTYRLKFNHNSVLSDRGQYVSVVSITETKSGSTWCCTEPLENKFVANGILTGNCTEILQPTSPPSYRYNSKTHTNELNDGEVSFCQLGGLVMSPTVTQEDLPRITYWMLRFQEAVFNTSEYSKISFSHKQKARRNIGIGLVNYQYLLVREVYSKYPETEWVQKVAEVTHEWYEAIQFNLIKANIQLAKELGPCELADDSKYSKGIFPIDHYHPTKLTDYPLKQDWESLRPLAIKYKVRFGTITALMPGLYGLL